MLSAVESVGAKVGDIQVKTSGANNIKICTFMEEDNFVNSQEANKKNSKNDSNLLKPEKYNPNSMPGMLSNS